MPQMKVCDENPRGLVVLAWWPINTTASRVPPPCAFVSDGSVSVRARSAIGRTSIPSGMRSRSMLVPTMCQSPTEICSTPPARRASIAVSASSVINLRPLA